VELESGLGVTGFWISFEMESKEEVVQEEEEKGSKGEHSHKSIPGRGSQEEEVEYITESVQYQW